MPEPIKERVALGVLHPHPRNYRKHPPDQIEHLRQSIRQFGVFRNIVVARDYTILAGHGVTEAATLEGVPELEVYVLDLDPDSPEALKVLALDNEVSRFAENDDRALTELLREVSQGAHDGLLGTGYDDMVLANLLMVTRPASEIVGFDAAAEWVGMPDYEAEVIPWKIMLAFENVEDRTRFMEQFNLAAEVTFTHADGRVLSAVWPKRDSVRHDAGLRWVEDEDEAASG